MNAKSKKHVKNVHVVREELRKRIAMAKAGDYSGATDDLVYWMECAASLLTDFKKLRHLHNYRMEQAARAQRGGLKMTVYVDNARIPWTPRKKRFQKPWLMSHLFCASPSELHDFAESIGIRREWYQGPKAHWPHYDITEKYRRIAIKEGAIEIEYRDLPAKLKELGIERGPMWSAP